MRVDAHVHIWPTTAKLDVDPLLNEAGSIESLIAAMMGSDIAAAVLVQPFASGLDHSYLLRALLSSQLRAVGIAQADPQDAASTGIITSLMETGRVVGFRLPLVRADDEWLSRHADEYWVVASTRRVVISLLAAPVHFEQIGSAAAAHPSVPVVIDHLGRFDLSDDHEESVAKLCRLACLPNVHVKASAIHALGRGIWPYRDVWPHLLEIIDSFGTERVMWGSEYPFVLSNCPYRDSPLAIERALAQRYGGQVADILGGNALRLFFGDQGIGL